MWKSWVLHHLQSATFFARMAGEVEEAWGGTENPDESMRYRAYVTGAIFAAAAFLDTSINELYAESHGQLPTGMGGGQTRIVFGPQARQLDLSISDLLSKKRFGRNSSFLSKYQSALIIARKPQFGTRDPLYRNADILRQFRNDLVHWSPEWEIANWPQDPSKIHKVPLVGRCPPNPMVPSTYTGEDYERYLSYGCAVWGVRSSLDFTDEFYRRLEITPPYENFTDRL
jgi:hypothetical protein